MNPITHIQNNRWHSQEIIGALAVAAAAKLISSTNLISKYIQPINSLTAFAAGVNGAGVLMIAKSVHTLYGDRRDRSAQKALAVGLMAVITATLLGGTTILKTRHTSLPALNKFAMPLLAATGATVILTEGGIRGIKKAHEGYQGLVAARATADPHDLDS